MIVAAPQLPPGPDEPTRRERLAAWHRTVAVTDETVPNSALFTYINKSFTYADNNWLAKLMPYVETASGLQGPDAAASLKVADTPGGIRATFTIEGVNVTTRLVPLCVGRGGQLPEGCAVYRITTEPATPVVVRIGSGTSLNLIRGSDGAGLRSDHATAIEGDLRIEGRSASFRGGVEKVPVVLRAELHAPGQADSTRHTDAPPSDLSRSDSPSPDSSRQAGAIPGRSETRNDSADAILERDGENGALAAHFESGQGTLIIAFAPTAERATEIAKTDADEGMREVAAYYERLWSNNHIETPEPMLDDAFRHALRTLEYTWIEPIGWLECIHHWLSLWHMQATAGAEWIGQADRSRMCTLYHADRLTGEGAVPQMSPSQHVHRDFGGSNQYWAWQVRHYWEFTADRRFVEQITPAYDRVLAQTFREYDKDDNGLLAWGLQIGNQEDYVATPYDGTTPSIEGINMMRTRAALADVLDEADVALRWRGRAARTASLLCDRLWMRDLGRYAFFVDPQGNRRLDGQYHTFTYPVIWGLADALDAYTSLRHLHDRLTGAGGEVYCSNNFPNHVNGTWGMQAGAAQQPWAAWAFSAAGQYENTYKPLLAAARWAMDKNHRGAWPEVAVEDTAAYFSPPAGLYVAATVEALFGLKLDAPAGVLHVAPSFPSGWPHARLQVAEFSAELERGEHRIDYAVASEQPWQRRFRYHLPPCRISRVLIDGQEVPYKVKPWVDGIVVEAGSAAATHTTLTILIDGDPIEYDAEHPLSVAEGDAFEVRLDGLRVDRVCDRGGVLAEYREDGGSRIVASVRRGLLEPYMAFGRLGQLTFSRRTFFVEVSRDDGPPFWLPVDLLILPRYEAAPASSDRERAVVLDTAGDLAISLIVRNNTSEPLQGPAHLLVACGDSASDVDIAPRSQQVVTFTVPATHVGLLSPGDNMMTLTLDHWTADVMVPVDEAIADNEPLSRAARAGLVHVPLDESAMIPDTEWTTLRVCPAYPHMPWAGARPPLEAVADAETIHCPGLPHVSFALPGRRFIPVAFKAGRPGAVIDLDALVARKLYLLVIPFMDNHDMFTDVGRVTVRSTEEIVYSRRLRFPGDVDWWFPPAIVADFATAPASPREDRLGLLGLRRSGHGDWRRGLPPAFPQKQYWSKSRFIVTPSSLMSVVEIDLGRPLPLDSLTLGSIGADPAFGIVALTAMTSGGQQHLLDTAWMPPLGMREPRTVFNFDRGTELEGWEITGDAFSVSTYPHLFTTQTLNSLAAAGEAATGRAVSPAFEIRPGENVLLLQYHGGRSTGQDGPGLLAIDLIDADSGERLHRMAVDADHTLRLGRIAVEQWSGRSVRLALTDEHRGDAFAWMGVASVELTAE